MSVFSSYPNNNPLGYEKVLLSSSTMENEDYLDTDENFIFLKFVLLTFGKKMTHIVFVAGDKCSTNRAMYRRIGPKFFGFNRHRFKWCVKEIIRQKKDVIDGVK